MSDADESPSKSLAVFEYGVLSLILVGIPALGIIVFKDLGFGVNSTPVNSLAILATFFKFTSPIFIFSYRKYRDRTASNGFELLMALLVLAIPPIWLIGIGSVAYFLQSLR